MLLLLFNHRIHPAIYVYPPLYILLSSWICVLYATVLGERRGTFQIKSGYVPVSPEILFDDGEIMPTFCLNRRRKKVWDEMNKEAYHNFLKEKGERRIYQKTLTYLHALHYVKIITKSRQFLLRNLMKYQN